MRTRNRLYALQSRTLNPSLQQCGFIGNVKLPSKEPNLSLFSSRSILGNRSSNQKRVFDGLVGRSSNNEVELKSSGNEDEFTFIDARLVTREGCWKKKEE